MNAGDVLTAAGYAPCPASLDGGQPCGGRGWPTDAADLDGGRALVTYGPGDCGHTIAAAFVVNLDPDNLGGLLDGEDDVP